MTMLFLRQGTLSKTLVRSAIVLVVGAMALDPAFAQAQTSYIYVESNNAAVPDQNSIFAYSNDGHGNLTALPGSPYLTSGTGVNSSGSGELNCDQQVMTDTAGDFLYAVNGGSNSVAAFTINADGTLTTVPNSPFASGGQDPVSVGLDRGFLVVANKNFDPTQDIDGDVPNYTTFAVRPNGSLRMNPGSTLDLAAGSGPSQAAVAGRWHLVFGLELFTSRIASYKYDRTGLMSEVSSVAPTTVNGAFLGEILHPRQKVLYAGLLSANQLGVFSFDAEGVISFVQAVSNEGIDICWLKTNAAGTRLYTSESLTFSVTVYDITDALNPVQLQHVALIGADRPVTNITLDPTERFFYALAGRGVHVLKMDANGMLNETTSPLVLPGSIDESPIGLAAIRK
jgi:6-phosphogluconolactonase (cycloisomerase 2 family)